MLYLPFSYPGYVNESLYTGSIDYQNIPNGQVSYWLQEITCKSNCMYSLVGRLIHLSGSDDRARKYHILTQWLCVLRCN